MPEHRHPSRPQEEPSLLGNLLAPPRRAVPEQASEPRGQCRGPNARTPHSQPVGRGPQLPTRRTSRRGRAIAGPETPFIEARAPPPPGCPLGTLTMHNVNLQERAVWGC